MTRFAFARSALLALAFATLGSFTAAGCNKPTKDECHKAIDNMRNLMGTDLLEDQDTQGWIRRCNGGSKKEAVLCAIKATTMDELRACQFMHLPNGKGVGDQPFPGEGSATPSMTPTGSGSATGSGSGVNAATGSNVGSAAPAPNAGITADTGSGSAAGSGAGSDAGSATGSASGSAATGSGGAATGSAAPAMGGAGSGPPAPTMSGAGAGSAH